MEKHDARIPPEVKILDSKIESPTKQHDNPVVTEDAEHIIKLTSRLWWYRRPYRYFSPFGRRKVYNQLYQLWRYRRPYRTTH